MDNGPPASAYLVSVDRDNSSSLLRLWVSVRRLPWKPVGGVRSLLEGGASGGGAVIRSELLNLCLNVGIIIKHLAQQCRGDEQSKCICCLFMFRQQTGKPYLN